MSDLAWRELEDHAERLEEEVARLRAGEAEDRGPLGSVPTPAQWIRRFNDASAGRRLAWADRIVRLNEEDARCFQLDHDGAVEQLREAWATLGRVQDLHRSYAIYEACGHGEDEHEPGTQVVNLVEDGETCLTTPTVIVCRECCTDDDGVQTEQCVTEHDHSSGWICNTRAALDEPDAPPCLT